jgi:multicomponent Na+:H+ antiporter subunit D
MSVDTLPPEQSVPLAPAVALLALALGLTVAAGPIHALAGAAAEQLLQPHQYIHAVLGGRP